MSRAQLYFITAILFALTVAVFAIQNPETITINFLAWQYTEISKVLVILASTAFGALAVLFLGFWFQVKKLMYTRQLEGEIKELKKKLAEAVSAEEKARSAEQSCSAVTARNETPRNETNIADISRPV